MLAINAAFLVIPAASITKHEHRFAEHEYELTGNANPFVPITSKHERFCCRAYQPQRPPAR